MRIAAFISLVLAAGLVTTVDAQEAVQPAPAAPAAAPSAPPATDPAAPATDVQAPTASPAPSAPPAAEPAPPPPTLPTTGDGAVLISVIEKICVPLVRGGDLNALAKAAGGRKDRRTDAWFMALGGSRDYIVAIFPLGSNKDVCRGEIRYAVNQTEPLVTALNVWAFLHQPELILQANYVKVYDDGVKRVQRSWEHLETNASQAVNFTTLTKPDDSALSGKYSVAEFYYQERKF